MSKFLNLDFNFQSDIYIAAVDDLKLFGENAMPFFKQIIF